MLIPLKPVFPALAQLECLLMPTLGIITNKAANIHSQKFITEHQLALPDGVSQHQFGLSISTTIQENVYISFWQN